MGCPGEKTSVCVLGFGYRAGGEPVGKKFRLGVQRFWILVSGFGMGDV